MTKALLALADGTVFEGRAYGVAGETFGEVVFNTSLTGYQEILTDPSYNAQIVTMTYPHQGNYGVNHLDEEADRPWVRGFVVRDPVSRPSSWRAEEGLEDYLVRHGIVGIKAIDTRSLVRRLRSAGAMQGAISTTDLDPRSLVQRIKVAPPLVGTDSVLDVTPKAAYEADVDFLLGTGRFVTEDIPRDAEGVRVAAMDFGMKRHILRCMVARGMHVKVFPATATVDEIAAFEPDGVFLSNGPGDPEPLTYAVDTIRDVLDRQIPTFGICLGHQLLGVALGATTFKLKFGHRGANHPVKCLATGRVEITSQNHGFAVHTGIDAGAWEQLAKAKAGDYIWRTDRGDVELSHFNLNDGTLEGLRCRDVPAYSVQYHPEAAPGPHDAKYLFDDFVQLIGSR